MDLLLIFGVPLAGFAAGYSFRAYISRRRRRLAQQHSLWQKPPDEPPRLPKGFKPEAD